MGRTKISRRYDFTRKITSLLYQMIIMGEYPILDYVKRGKETQYALYKAGKSKCDGKRKISKHQLGLAADIYFVNRRTGKLIWDEEKYVFWHKVWQRDYHGKKMIKWDLPHFEYGGK